MTTDEIMALADAHADAECDYRMSGKATSCQEEYAADMAKAALRTAIEALVRDHQRMEYILDNCTSIGGGHGFTLSVFVPCDLEDIGCAIDAAIAAQEVK